MCGTNATAGREDHSVGSGLGRRRRLLHPPEVAQSAERFTFRDNTRDDVGGYFFRINAMNVRSETDRRIASHEILFGGVEGYIEIFRDHVGIRCLYDGVTLRYLSNMTRSIDDFSHSALDEHQSNANIYTFTWPIRGLFLGDISQSRTSCFAP